VEGDRPWAVFFVEQRINHHSDDKPCTFSYHGGSWINVAGACRCKKVENGVAAMNSKQLSCNIATRAAPSIVKGE
jgi:hypothetical protein